MAISRRPHELESHTQFTLRTLGSVALSRSSANTTVDEPIPPAGKQLALLAYLACSDGRAARRDDLFNLFAPRPSPGDDAASEAKAADAVRHLLQQVRSKLGAEALGPPRSDPVRLTIPLTCDRDELLAAWDRRDFRAVAACYTGEFLPRLETVATPDFAMWVERERANLSRRFAHAARHTIAQDIAAAPEPAALRRALDLAWRLRAQEPLAQDAWQLLLRCLILCGEHEGAALEADQFEGLLTEHGVSAEPATRSILKVARAAPARALALSSAEPSVPAFGNIVGRSREVAAILAAWDRARAGTFVHLHVVAGAGFGKSALLADVRQRLRARPAGRGGTRVVEARASQASRDIAFAFAGDVVRALAERPGGLAVSEWSAAVLVGLHPALSIHYRNAFAAPSVTPSERQRHVAIQELIAARHHAADGRNKGIGSDFRPDRTG